MRKKQYKREIIEVERIIAKLGSELKAIYEEEQEAQAEDQEHNSWRKNAASSRFSVLSDELESEKEERAQARLRRLASMTVIEAALVKSETRRRIWSNMLSDVNDELRTEKAEQKRRATKRQAEDEAEARTKQFEALMRDPDEWWEVCNDEAGLEASAAAEARNERGVWGPYQWVRKERGEGGEEVEEG
jgi:hypothetical protein